MSGPATPNLAGVALSRPLPFPLTYSIPPELRALVVAGARVRVPLGRRTEVGMVVDLEPPAPPGAQLKAILEVIDAEPLLSPDLIELGRFAADYYLAPIGEVTQLLWPSDLPPWGNWRVKLTDRGALALPRDATEAKLRDFLLEHGAVRSSDLQSLGLDRLNERLRDWLEQGRLCAEESGRGTRFVKALELVNQPFAEIIERCGRAPQGRAVLELLHALGRPATLLEIEKTLDCGPATVRRLVKLGLLREFTQPERLDLLRHSLGGDHQPPITLRGDQEQARAALASAVQSRSFGAFLLHGMTGSGKTEVFLRVAALALEQGRSVILMVPEIALVPALAEQARARFGDTLAILHSNLSRPERHQEWQRLRRGEARVVVGPRSALFAPVKDLGFVVVDEEHDGAYKQDNGARYNGRDLALWRAQAAQAVALLVSATPSLESRHNATKGKLKTLILNQRAGASGLPEGILVDLRQEPGARKPGEVFFSSRLLVEIRQALDAGDQIMLLRNRRGYAPVLLCRACGEDFRCPDCGLPRTLHLRSRLLVCHYCGDKSSMPTRCPKCGEAALEPIGAGTERVEERIRELYPEVAVDVLDADVNQKIGGAAAVLERFRNGATQVLIGTQMISKGHHFPRVALAAVLFADTYLAFPDFRAVERTYSLLAQLAGRAGRGDRPGRVVIQTFHPGHYAIRAALEHDDEAFAVEELRFRRTFHYPPFTRLIALQTEHAQVDRARRALEEIKQLCLAEPRGRDLRVQGVAPAPLERLRGKWRFQLLLRGPNGKVLRQIVARALEQASASTRELLRIDVDPYDLL